MFLGLNQGLMFERELIHTSIGCTVLEIDFTCIMHVQFRGFSEKDREDVHRDGWPSDMAYAFICAAKCFMRLRGPQGAIFILRTHNVCDADVPCLAGFNHTSSHGDG